MALFDRMRLCRLATSYLVSIRPLGQPMRVTSSVVLVAGLMHAALSEVAVLGCLKKGGLRHGTLR